MFSGDIHRDTPKRRHQQLEEKVAGRKKWNDIIDVVREHCEGRECRTSCERKGDQAASCNPALFGAFEKLIGNDASQCIADNAAK